MFRQKSKESKKYLKIKKILVSLRKSRIFLEFTNWRFCCVVNGIKQPFLYHTLVL